MQTAPALNVHRAISKLELYSVPLLILVFAYISYGIGLAANTKLWFINLSWTFAALFAGLRCLYESQNHSGVVRKAWLFFATGCISWFAGMLVWDYLELIVRKTTPFPAWSDVGFMLFAPFFMVGLVLLKGHRKDTRFTLIELSKLGVIVASLIFIHLYILLSSILQSKESGLYISAALAYPVLYMTTLVYGVVSLKNYRAEINPGAYLLVLAGVAVHAFTDSLYAFSLLGKNYSVGSYLDIYWMIGFGLIYVAAVVSGVSAKKNKPHGMDEKIPAAGSVVERLDILLAPISLVILALVLVLFTDQLHIDNLRFLTPVFAALLFFIALHQIAVEHLQRELYGKLVTSDQRYQDMTSSMPGIVYQFKISRNGEYTFPYVSPTVGNILNISPDRIMEDYQEVFSRIHPDDLEKFQEGIQYSRQNLTPWSWDGRVYKDNSIVWIRCRSFPREQDDGSVLWNGIVLDITEQKKAEEVLQRSQEELEKLVKERTLSLEQEVIERKQTEIALREARDEAENANQAKSQFMSRMSHELRTPMNAILGFGQLLDMDQSLTDDQKSGVNEILQAGNHLLELINELLDLSRIEAGKLELIQEKVSFCEVVNECMKLASPMAEKGDIRVIANFNGCSSIYIFADRLRIKQVLLNLLTNAIKYNRKGGSVEIRCEMLDQGVCRVSISDTGMGIPEDQLDRLFKSFSRLGAELTGIEGTGIGLFITKQLLEKMGGTISVESRVGSGSTFSFTLPLIQHDIDTVSEEKKLSRDIARATTTANFVVYYVEDNVANQNLMKRILSRNPDVAFYASRDAETALQEIPEIRPDVVLMDITLPGMDGFEALSHLRQNPLVCDIPVIAVSANAMQRDIDRGRESGFDGYITKPIDLQELYRVLLDLLGKDIRGTQ